MNIIAFCIFSVKINSAKKPLSRRIPRIFIFDCCSGNGEKDSEYRQDYEYEKMQEDQGKNMKLTDIEMNEIGKRISLNDVVRQNTLVWAGDEDNPDYRLVTVNAANEGFQSKMCSVNGSYVIKQFIQKTKENVNKKNPKFLKHILDEIQEDLHDKGKQLMTKTFNNKTEYIKFIPKEKANITARKYMIDNNDEKEDMPLSVADSDSEDEIIGIKNNVSDDNETIQMVSFFSTNSASVAL